MQFKFSLAKFINDREFISKVQKLMDDSNSRLLELLYERNTSKEEEIVNRIEDLKEEAINTVGDEPGLLLYNELKNSNGLVIANEKRKFSRKLSKLRTLKQAHDNAAFKVSKGSRRLSAQKYKKKENNGEISGAPFPQNLRKARRGRPQQPRVNTQEYQVTAEDLEERNPIILSNQNVELDEDAKSLLRKSPKFVPTPRGPINEKGHYESFLRFRESLRWKWFFHKHHDPNEIEDEYSSKP